MLNCSCPLPSAPGHNCATGWLCSCPSLTVLYGLNAFLSLVWYCPWWFATGGMCSCPLSDNVRDDVLRSECVPVPCLILLVMICYRWNVFLSLVWQCPDDVLRAECIAVPCLTMSVMICYRLNVSLSPIWQCPRCCATVWMCSFPLFDNVRDDVLRSERVPVPCLILSVMMCYGLNVFLSLVWCCLWWCATVWTCFCPFFDNVRDDVLRVKCVSVPY